MDADQAAGRKSCPPMTEMGEELSRAPTMPPPRYPELRDRVAVVTGAAKGIGKGIAGRLAHEGMRVVLADNDEPSLAKTASELDDLGATVLEFAGDLSRHDQISRLFDTVVDEFETVDLLVNNAADLQRRRVLDDHAEVLELQLATNIRGPYLCSQRAAAIMADRRRGCIIQISSVGGLRAHDRGLPYDVTKGAIDAMTRAMAVDLGEYGIRVNAVAPGITHTHRTPVLQRFDPRDDRVPLQRAGTPTDVASAVAFLASPDADYITGQVLYVDGGFTAQLSPRGDFSKQVEGSGPEPDLEQS